MRLSVSSSGRASLLFGPIGGLLWLALLCLVFGGLVGALLPTLFTITKLLIVAAIFGFIYVCASAWRFEKALDRKNEEDAALSGGEHMLRAMDVLHGTRQP